jgi:arylsulfatase
VVLYDRENDPAEMTDLAADSANREIEARYLAKLESLIDSEISKDTRTWVAERPQLLGWPTWSGDTVAPAPRASRTRHCSADEHSLPRCDTRS